MDDIVTRLRGKYAGQLLICTEAADEIERLRADRDSWKRTCARLVGMMLPYSLLMTETEREELKIILHEASNG